MLPNELRTAIDKRWEAFWPTNNVKPLIIIDLITYLLFVKRIEEQTTANDINGFSGQSPAPAVYTEKQKELRWSSFKDMDSVRMHQVFTKEQGVAAFMNQYGKGQHRYSSFMKAPLLVTPTPKLLENAVEIVKILDASDKDVKAQAYEYLLTKLTTSGPNGELPTPPHITRLMVEMMEPTPEDVICDPSAGNGRLLTACAAYIKEKHSGGDGTYHSLPADKWIGLEFDPVMHRIGAMNMMLHGIEDPKLLQVNALSKANAAFNEQATLVLANPPFSASPGHTELDDSLSKMGNHLRPGILFLALILRGLKKGGRAAVILPESILADSSTAHQQVREQLIEEHKLEAVISLPAGLFRPFTGVGTAILIFTKTENGGTDKVWFYDMRSDGLSLDDKRMPLHPSGKYNGMLWPENYGDIPHLLTQWRAIKDGPTSTTPPVSLQQAGNTGTAFFVPAEALRENDYSLKINRYQQPEPKQDTIPKERMVPEKEVVPEKKPVVQEKAPPRPSVVPIPAAPIPLKEKKVAPPPIRTAPALKVPSWPVLLLLSVVGIGTLMYFLIRKDRPSVLSATASNVPGRVQEQRPVADTSETAGYVHPTKLDEAVDPGAEEEEQSSDPTKAESVESRPSVSERTRQEAQLAKVDRNTVPEERKPAVLQEPGVSAGNVQIRYQVKSKAYFHNEPNESSRRQAFINHWNNSYAALNPLDEKNGFVYVVFTNHQGQTSRGWLRKKDLKAVRTVVSDDELK